MDFFGRSDRMEAFRREEKACCFHYIASIKVYSNLDVLVCLVFCTIRMLHVYISIYHCLLQQISNGSSRKDMYVCLYISICTRILKLSR